MKRYFICIGDKAGRDKAIQEGGFAVTKIEMSKVVEESEFFYRPELNGSFSDEITQKIIGKPHYLAQCLRHRSDSRFNRLGDFPTTPNKRDLILLLNMHKILIETAGYKRGTRVYKVECVLASPPSLHAMIHLHYPECEGAKKVAKDSTFPAWTGVVFETGPKSKGLEMSFFTVI